MLKYEKISLFDAPKNSLIVHAVNAGGRWGSGIAKEFKKRYPKAETYYMARCAFGSTLARFGCHHVGEEHLVGWLGTSAGYGHTKSPEDEILIYTTLAIQEMLISISKEDQNLPRTVYSNKFNSGLFEVPWEKTEKILKTILKLNPHIEWIVCDPT
jgi:ADP-ribose 1''-phosphate phosphatase